MTDSGQAIAPANREAVQAAVAAVGQGPQILPLLLRLWREQSVQSRRLLLLLRALPPLLQTLSVRLKLQCR